MSVIPEKPLKRGWMPASRVAGINVSPLLVEAARQEPEQVCQKLETSTAGLTQLEADQRLEKHGPNEVAQEREHGWAWRLLMACRNPLVILLSGLAVVSLATGDVSAATVMAL